MKNLNSSALNSLIQEQTVEAVSESDESYRNMFSDGLAMDFFAEDDKAAVKVSLKKAKRKPQKFDQDVNF